MKTYKILIILVVLSLITLILTWSHYKSFDDEHEVKNKQTQSQNQSNSSSGLTEEKTKENILLPVKKDRGDQFGKLIKITSLSQRLWPEVKDGEYFYLDNNYRKIAVKLLDDKPVDGYEGTPIFKTDLAVLGILTDGLTKEIWRSEDRPLEGYGFLWQIISLGSHKDKFLIIFSDVDESGQGNIYLYKWTGDIFVPVEIDGAKEKRGAAGDAYIAESLSDSTGYLILLSKIVDGKYFYNYYTWEGNRLILVNSAEIIKDHENIL